MLWVPLGKPAGGWVGPEALTWRSGLEEAPGAGQSCASMALEPRCGHVRMARDLNQPTPHFYSRSQPGPVVSAIDLSLYPLVFLLGMIDYGGKSLYCVTCLGTL